MPFGLSTLAIKAIGIGLLVLALLGGCAWLVHHLEGIGEQREKDHVAAIVAANVASAAAADARIAAQQKENDREADKFNALAGMGAAHASDAADRLRNRFARAGAVPQGAPALAASAPASAGAGRDVRADVFGVVVDAARRLAARCDQYHGPGVAAEAQYDALNPSAP